MTDDMFAQPASSSPLDLHALIGALLLIDVLSLEDHVPTVHTLPGEKTPAVRADVAVLDGPHAGEPHDGSLIFPRILQSQLKSNVGKKVLGRLRQGVAKPGKTAPWELAAATDADTAMARAWVARQGAPVSAGPVDALPPF